MPDIRLQAIPNSQYIRQSLSLVGSPDKGLGGTVHDGVTGTSCRLQFLCDR